MAALAARGLGSAEIARALGLARQSVEGLAARHGIALPRKSPRAHALPREEVLRRLAAGQDAASVADDLGCRVRSVYQILRRHGGGG